MDGHGFPLGDYLGMTIELPEQGVAVARVEVTERHHNPHGYLHGAVLFALVDTAMGGATMSLLDPGQRCATIEIQTRFLRPVKSGTVEAQVRVLQAGRRIVHLEAEVTADGRPVAAATGSFSVIDGG